VLTRVWFLSVLSDKLRDGTINLALATSFLMLFSSLFTTMKISMLYALELLTGA